MLSSSKILNIFMVGVTPLDRVLARGKPCPANLAVLSILPATAILTPLAHALGAGSAGKNHLDIHAAISIAATRVVHLKSIA